MALFRPAALAAALLLAWATFLSVPGALAWPTQFARQPSQAPAAIEVSGVRVLDSGLLEPLPPRDPDPKPSGPVTLLGGVDGVEGVVAVPAEIQPKDRLAAPPEREYRILSQAAKVYALPGQAVGFGYVPAGTPVGSAVPMQVVVSFPPQGEAPRRTETLEREVVLGRADWAAWDFPAEAPVEGGRYVIEVRCQGVELARRAFLVAPRAVPAPSPAPSPALSPAPGP